MKKVLITGGAGFIGSHLAESLIKKGYFVIVVDNLQTGSLDNLKKLNGLKNFIFIKKDVNKFIDISNVFFDHKINFVFHYAATVGVERTLDNPLQVFDDIEGIKNILILSKLSGVERIFYSSSSEVYGEPVDRLQNEDKTPLNARLPYAIVKNLSEAYIRAYHKKYRLDYTIFRFFNTYGPRQSTDFVLSKFISQTLKNEDIIIYGDGNQTRSFCYVADNIKATTNALKSKEAINKIINIGSDYEITINQLADIFLKLANSKNKIKHLSPRQEGDMRCRRPDISRMKKILKVKELISLEKGIKNTIDWHKKHQKC